LDNCSGNPGGLVYGYSSLLFSGKFVKGADCIISCWCVWYLLFPHPYTKGKRLIVAVGQCLIQLAKANEAKCIIATAGSDEKTKLCEDLGATKGINYKKADWAEEVKKIAPGGVDFIVDFIMGTFKNKDEE
jgi:NADPH:quinone reductase-like Zn-dependent oxidoreductase